MTGNEMALMASIAVDMQDKEVDDVLDKIRSEIEAEKNAGGHTWYIGGLDFALSIIDKYMKESEET